MSARLLAFITISLFQSHWIDDLGSGASDTAGVVVSAIGTLLIGAGFALRARAAGRLVLALGLLFAAFVSVADIIGLQPDGSRKPDMLNHWATGLGWMTTPAAAVTLACAVAALAVLIVGRRPGS